MEREALLSAAAGLAVQVGVRAACTALGVARATFYRRRRPKTGQRRPRPAPARALDAAERAEVFGVLCSPRCADRAPAEVYATLLDEGVYLCSERTMYRRPGREGGGPRAPGAAQPSQPPEARGGGPRTQ